MKKPQFLVVHNTAVERTLAKQLRGVNAYHQEKWNMLSSLGWYVGYNEFVDVDGVRTKTRAWGEETIAQKGHNCDIASRCTSYSVCFALDGAQQTFSPDQIKAWREIRAEHPQATIRLHRDMQEGRTCPGKLITVEYLQSILTDEEQGEEDEAKRKAIAEQIKLLDALVALLVKLLNRK